MNSRVFHLSIILQRSLLSPTNGQDNGEEILNQYQYDIAKEGQEFLLSESERSSFFLLGELHGEQDLPQLLYSPWPKMNAHGYSHVIAELSPWSADKLEIGVAPDQASGKL